VESDQSIQHGSEFLIMRKGILSVVEQDTCHGKHGEEDHERVIDLTRFVKKEGRRGAPVQFPADPAAGAEDEQLFNWWQGCKLTILHIKLRYWV